MGLSRVAEALWRLDRNARGLKVQILDGITDTIAERMRRHGIKCVEITEMRDAMQGTFDAQRRTLEEGINAAECRVRNADARQQRAADRRDELAQLLLKSQRREEIALSLLSKRARAKCHKLVDEL